MGSIPGAVGNFNFPINGAQATSLTPFGFVSGVVNGNGPSRLEIGPNGISSALVGNNFTPDPNSSIVNMAVPGAAPFTFNASGGLNSQANGLMPTITGQNPIFSGQLTSFGGSGNNPFGITPPTQALSGGNLFNTGFLSPGAGPAFTGNASSGFTSLVSNLQNTLQQMTQALSQISGALGFGQMAPQLQGFAGNAGSSFPAGMIPFNPQMQGFAGNAGSSFPAGMMPFSPQMQGFAGNAGSSFPAGMIPFSPQMQGFAGKAGSSFPAGMIPFNPQLQGFSGNAGSSFPAGMIPFGPQMQGFAGNAGSSFPAGMIPFSPQMQGFAGNVGSSFPAGIAANGGNLLSNPLLNGQVSAMLQGAPNLLSNPLQNGQAASQLLNALAMQRTQQMTQANVMGLMNPFAFNAQGTNFMNAVTNNFNQQIPPEFASNPLVQSFTRMRNFGGTAGLLISPMGIIVTAIGPQGGVANAGFTASQTMGSGMTLRLNPTNPSMIVEASGPVNGLIGSLMNRA